MPCFVRIQDDKADKMEKSKPKEPAMKYAQTARCVDFVPHPQHDELPKVNCLKLGKKLESFRELIKTSSCKKKVLKSGSQIDSSVVKLEPTGLNTEDSLFEPSKKSSVVKNTSPSPRKSTVVGKESAKPGKSSERRPVRDCSLNQSLLTPVVYSISSL